MKEDDKWLFYDTLYLNSSIFIEILNVLWNIWVTYSYNSIKHICSIKRPGLEIFKNILLNVPYHR